MGSMSIWHWLIVLVVVAADLRHEEAAQHRPGSGRRGEGLQGRRQGRRGRRRRGEGGRRARGEDRRHDDRGRGQEGADAAGLTAGCRARQPAPSAGRCSTSAMFDIGFSEIMVIAVVALIVLGPEKLPKTARTLGHLFGRLQRYVADVKADINRELALEDLKKLQAEVKYRRDRFPDVDVRDGAGSRGERPRRRSEPQCRGRPARRRAGEARRPPTERCRRRRGAADALPSGARRAEPAPATRRGRRRCPASTAADARPRR